LKKILITGGAGFIGSNFIHYLLKNEPDVEVVNLDILTYAGSMENLKDLQGSNRHIFIREDICDQALVEEIFDCYEIDTVIHFAAETHVDRSIHNPAKFIQTNVIGTLSLLEAARKYWVDNKMVSLDKARFHHVSTDEVFGSLNPGDPPWDETTPYAPNSPYSASKAASDHLVRAYHHTYGLPVTISNCSNNYGPFQFPEKLIPLMILNMLSGKPLPVYGDGKQVRDWIFVEDHCEAIHLTLKLGKIGETYNFGGGNEPSNIELVQDICEIMDEIHPGADHQSYKLLLEYVADRPGHDRRYAMDITKAKNELGWQPRLSLRGGLIQTVTWYLQHREWVINITEKPEYKAWLDRNYQNR
jgi:dTDP-glucose 4,6-dehydratase